MMNFPWNKLTERIFTLEDIINLPAWTDRNTHLFYIMANLPEVWLRGPVTGIPSLLQPVAHTLLQAREEVEEMMKDFPETLLWEKPAGLASPGFHLQHLTGVLERLFTYANNTPLNDEQMQRLALEGTPVNIQGIVNVLLNNFRQQVDAALRQLAQTPEDSLTEPRGVGRKKIPSTVIGLLFHAAEHTQRHTGQLLVTVNVLKNSAHHQA
jgi:hypothetical protein